MHEDPRVYSIVPWFQKLSDRCIYLFHPCQKQAGIPVKCSSCRAPVLSVENGESSGDMTNGALPYTNGLGSFDPESTNSESSMN